MINIRSYITKSQDQQDLVEINGFLGVIEMRVLKDAVRGIRVDVLVLFAFSFQGV